MLMRFLLPQLAWLALIASGPVLAQAVPKVGACPSGYGTSGDACVPFDRSGGARPALPRVGPCPSGYGTSGDYCLAFGPDARHAIPKSGACPSGYGTSGAYCLSFR